MFIYMNIWVSGKDIMKQHSLTETFLQWTVFRRHYWWRLYIHTYAQKLFEEFSLKNLGDYYQLYVQSDTLLLTDVFENFINKCMKIYELDLAPFLSALGSRSMVKTIHLHE